ncbi:hypothetical protein CARUB_v10016410mg [Capsella rubella]|uniref:Pectinesterase inhibitor domain-containing protein n=1 Tax=Capsella rubella TaxID=81985 RepID=R0I992_9BRAS|nr:uncharacterized protein LOC17892697 [Capsella rubella]EOA33073.1 hypothetical protein CARUB_v10016410mg [Capsella rubella]
MNHFTKLFAIFLVFIQIQIALSQSLEQKVCQQNRYKALCFSTLNNNPRSKTSNLHGLASIAFDATIKTFNDMEQFLIIVLNLVSRSEDSKKYRSCVEDYGAAINNILPAVVADLKAKKYPEAMSQMKEVLVKQGDCDKQFAGPDTSAKKTELMSFTKVVHDTADMTIDIIKMLSTN